MQQENKPEPSKNYRFRFKNKLNRGRLVDVLSRQNWVANCGVLIILAVLLVILFSNPEDSNLANLLRILAGVTTYSAALFGKASISRNAVKEHQREYDKLQLTLQALALFFLFVSFAV